jgi:hypothetical protein
MTKRSEPNPHVIQNLFHLNYFFLLSEDAPFIPAPAYLCLPGGGGGQAQEGGAGAVLIRKILN